MKKTLAVIIALVAVSSFAFAQQGGGGQRGQGGGQGQGQRQGGQAQRRGGDNNGAARLLAMPSVQTELNLTADQKSKISDLIPQRGQVGGQGGGQRGQGGGQRGQGEGEQGANRTNQADLDKKIAEILDDKQEARLAELVIQRAGNRAVLDEKVAMKLAITAEQKTQLADLREKQRAARASSGQPGQGTDREAARAAREKMEKELDAEIGKILTDKQKAELKTLGGKPFKFEN